MKYKTRFLLYLVLYSLVLLAIYPIFIIYGIVTYGFWESMAPMWIGIELIGIGLWIGIVGDLFLSSRDRPEKLEKLKKS